MRDRISATLLGSLMPLMLVPALAQNSTKLTVSVVSDKGTTSVTDATILLSSMRGWASGRSDQNFGGLYVTDALIPPDGVELKPTLIPWKSIQSVEFIDWNLSIPPNHRVKAKITMTKGSPREVFLWSPTNSQTFLSPYADHFRVNGRMSVGGSVQEVSIQGSVRWRRLDFSTSQ